MPQTLTNQQSYRLIAANQNFNGFDRHVMENVKIVDATPQGTVDFEFHIDERYTNLNGVMHGGAAGVIFDMCTTSALGPLAKPGFWEYVILLSKDISHFFPYEIDKNQFPRRSNQNAEYQLPESHSHGFVSPFLISSNLEISAYNAGTTIRIHSEVVQAGRTMAMIRGRMTSQDGKTTYCTVEHHKVSVPTQPHHLKHRVEWDGLWEADAVVPGKARL
jgi:acyl-coenzyme A thioesterase 13